MRQPLLAFMTDYGTRDGFPAVCHGVIASLAPEVRVLDVSHQVPPQDVRHGAIVLRRAARFLPPAVYVGVVDPGVGTQRRPIALRAGDSYFVGPDNGLLPDAAEARGTIEQVRVIANPDWLIATTDRTFDGRDVFAPVGARLAAGEPLSECGDELAPAELVRLPALSSRAEPDGAWRTAVRYLDSFGNVQLTGEVDEFAVPVGSAVRVTDADGRERGRAVAGGAFGDVAEGGLLFYADADGRPALAVRNGSAADLLTVRTGDTLRLSPA